MAAVAAADDECNANMLSLAAYVACDACDGVVVVEAGVAMDE